MRPSRCTGALEIDEASDRADHPDFARTLDNLAVLLWRSNQIAEAEPLFRHALAILEASIGPDHPDVAATLNNLAGLLRDTNRLAEAEPLYWRALAIDEASYGADHPNYARTLDNLGALLSRANRLGEAEQLFRTSAKILIEFEGETGREHPRLQQALTNYRGLLKALEMTPDQIEQTLNDLKCPWYSDLS